MALLGVIVGYALANLTGNPLAEPTQPPAAEAPKPPAPPAGDPTKAPKVDEADHILGNSDAEVSLIEYSDLECPFCKRNHPTVKQIVDAYDGKVNIVYRHFPLGFHPNAQKGAEATECVAELADDATVWKFIDKVFEKGAINEQYAAYAEEIGVDKAKVQDCLDSGKYTSNVSDERDAGAAAGVTGTPGNIVMNNKTGDAKLVSGARPFNDFKTAIDSMLE